MFKSKTQLCLDCIFFSSTPFPFLVSHPSLSCKALAHPPRDVVARPAASGRSHATSTFIDNREAVKNPYLKKNDGAGCLYPLFSESSRVSNIGGSVSGNPLVDNWVNRGAPKPSRNFLVLYVTRSHTPLSVVRQTATAAILGDLPGEGGAGHETHQASCCGCYVGRSDPRGAVVAQ